MADGKEYVLLSGLPRTGSTLLVALLTQNPRIHGEGASALCQLMWDNKVACENSVAIAANRRGRTKHDILAALPGLYYRNVERPVVIEKGRTWTHPVNFGMWVSHVNADQKIVALVRPAEEIVRSFAALRMRNGWGNGLYEDVISPGSEPLCRAVEALFAARVAFPERLLIVNYCDIVRDPIKVLDDIYAFHGWEPYPHVLEGITQLYPEDDTVHGLAGMHEIRDAISLREIDIELPQHVKDVCAELDKLVYGDIEKVEGAAELRKAIKEVWCGALCKG